MRLTLGLFASRRYSRFARRLRRGGRSAGSRCSLRVVCLTPLFALRAAAPAGRPFGRVALLPSGCLPHAAIRASRGGSGGAAVRPGRVAPLWDCLPHAAMRAARGGSGGAAVRPGRVAPFGFFASRRYARCARRLRRGGRSAGSRCSLRVFCLTPLCALRAAAPAGRPFGRVALLPSGFIASRRYARCARRLRRGGLSAWSRCSLWVWVSLPHAAVRAARGGSGRAAVRLGRVAPL